MSVAENLSRILQSFENRQVTLVAVSKYVGVEEIKEAYKSGVTEFGESRIQDAIKKQEAMPAQIAEHIHWHFIGHLQSNKVKKAVGRFKLIHSVDSIHLAEALSTEALKLGRLQPVLLQVKVLDDPDKTGFDPEELKERFSELKEFEGIKIEGLMTMTPLTDDQNIRKQCFLGLNRLREELANDHRIALKELSMGMSDDYEEAVKCGATIVRVGRAIFQKTKN